MPSQGPTTGEHVEGGDRLDEQAGRAEGDGGDHGTEPDATGAGPQETEGGVGLEHRLGQRARRVGLQQVVGHPQRVDAELVRRACHVAQPRRDLGRTARP
jgi:hypothetical protein